MVTLRRIELLIPLCSFRKVSLDDISVKVVGQIYRQISLGFACKNSKWLKNGKLLLGDLLEFVPAVQALVDPLAFPGQPAHDSSGRACQNTA